MNLVSNGVTVVVTYQADIAWYKRHGYVEVPNETPVEEPAGESAPEPTVKKLRARKQAE